MNSILIKPHHFIDIIKLYGSGIDRFVPDEKMGHDFYKVANEIIDNPSVDLKLTIDGDDICKPCKKYHEQCVDPLTHIQGYTSKDVYNKTLDKRIIKLYNLNDEYYTAKQLCSIIQNNKGCSVMIMDIDYFKSINDNYGHEAGDEVLIHVARVLKEQLLANGFVCRWGGEEFLIVIESHTIEQAEHILQSILDTLRNQTITYQEQQIRVTMSMGLVSVKAEDEIDDILRCADQKLYEAKENGRDQIRC